MSIKMVAMGIYGKGTYLAETWNRLDCFIVVAGYSIFPVFNYLLLFKSVRLYLIVSFLSNFDISGFLIFHFSYPPSFTKYPSIVFCFVEPVGHFGGMHEVALSNSLLTVELNYTKLWATPFPTWIEIWFSRAVEYCLDMENMNLSAIRTIRVLRPLRAINRIPSEYLFDIYLFVWHDNERKSIYWWRVPAWFRHENIGDALARHVAHARQCPVALLFRLFHLRNRRRSTLGRNPPAEMLPRPTQGHPPTAHFVSCRFLFQYFKFNCNVIQHQKVSFVCVSWWGCLYVND